MSLNTHTTCNTTGSLSTIDEDEDEEEVNYNNRGVKEEEESNNNMNGSNGTTNPSPVVCKPRRMTLEPMNATFLPLLFYLGIRCIYWAGALYLFWKGYRRFVSKSTGLIAWHRPSRRNDNNKNTTEKEQRPLLFFHGSAPGGLMPYLPMMFLGLMKEDDRPLFLFENRSISLCFFNFVSLTEEQTIQGIIEILKMNDCFESELSIVGHSFGSCTAAWLLQSNVFKPYIKQAVLIDPVSILLSEPDVMNNFLYGGNQVKAPNNPFRFISTELFLQYYLRRHFFWYNSELWLDDVDDSCSLLICLSGNDDIIDAQKVKAEVVRQKSKRKKQQLDLLFREGGTHASCISSTQMWKQMKQCMLQQQQQESSNGIRKKKNY
mmetsp:Transcript_25478/g.29108  ORF Transcript_25478/g.29108 Transcript_25478/m.29108 type:complete len:376 (+) Transcript_25478:223-1350(+)